MAEQSAQSMLRWISRTYDMSPTALARMFQRDRRTIVGWLDHGRISVRNGTRIRSAYYYLNNQRDPVDDSRSAIDMV